MSLDSLFDPRRKHASRRHLRVYALYELLFTLVDFAAAALFVIGSVLFFDESTARAATGCFLIGSVCFALKPSVRVMRELHLLRLGDVEQLAARATE